MRPYKTLDELIVDLHDKPCCICDQFIGLHFYPEKNAELIKNQMCFSCNLWYKRSLAVEQKHMIVNGQWYTIGEENPGFFKGFGGAKFTFIKDGKTYESNNIRFGGDIPILWQDKIPDNASMVQGREPIRSFKE